jgi:hypothetical protein
MRNNLIPYFSDAISLIVYAFQIISTYITWLLKASIISFVGSVSIYSLVGESIPMLIQVFFG